MKPGTASRSGMCSVSYQSWNSSSATSEKFIAAIRMPLAIASSLVAVAHRSTRRSAAQGQDDAADDQGDAEDDIGRDRAAEDRRRQQETADRRQRHDLTGDPSRHHRRHLAPQEIAE